MSYLDRVLQPGETVRYRGTVHWIVYLPAVVIAIIGIAAVALALKAGADRNTAGVIALIGFAIAFAFFGRAWFRRFSTELAVTNRRVIFKEGFISRRTIETNMDKVESVDVHQTVSARILNYGDVTIHGTGAGRESMRLVQSPLEFRNSITAG